MKSVTPDQWRSISAYLDQALELEEPARAELLAALAQNDPALAALLSSVLAEREKKAFSQFLADVAPIPLDDIRHATLVGRHVGPYVIEAEIGRGGMGSVWRARRADGRFEGNVAIKFVHAAWIGRIGEQRFLSEGKLLGRLDHPHVARLLDAGVLEATQPYLVLEYVDGAPIDEYCEHRSLGAEARIRLFLDVLDAVSHAHRNLIVHRDLKPSNIFVTDASHDGNRHLCARSGALLAAERLASVCRQDALPRGTDSRRDHRQPTACVQRGAIVRGSKALARRRS
jgi:eukaryotic-like serine/threonine-protein kinase